MLKLETPNFPAEFDNAWRASKKRKVSYRGKLLLPGEDAAIVVTPDALHTFLDGAPTPAGHPLMALAKNFEEEIRRATASEFGLLLREIVIVGRWHDNGGYGKDFEPYITRKIGNDGNVMSYKYDYRIFPCDGLGSGESFSMDFSKKEKGAEVRDCLTFFAKDITTPVDLSERAVITLGLPRGAIWYPPKTAGFPILVTEWERFKNWNDEEIIEPVLPKHGTARESPPLPFSL